MPQLVINKQYHDGTVLSEAQLDAAFASITTLLNTVGLGADNLQDNSVGSAEIQTSGVSNTNLATNSVSTTKIIDANVTLAKLDPIGVQTFLVPTGASLDYCLPSPIAPAGYLICDGSAISRATYSALFAIIGTNYGTGDGTTTFNIPDATGRVFRSIGGASGEAVYGQNGSNNVYQDNSVRSHAHSSNFDGLPLAFWSGGVGVQSNAGFQQQNFTGATGFHIGVPTAMTTNRGQNGLSNQENRMDNFQGYKIIKY